MGKEREGLAPASESVEVSASADRKRPSRPSVPAAAAARPLADVLFDHISPYLGPHMTRTALRTFSARAVGKTPDALARADMAPLLAALRQMLRALIGGQETEEVLQNVREDLGL